jgi:hypothetical protein
VQLLREAQVCLHIRGSSNGIIITRSRWLFSSLTLQTRSIRPNDPNDLTDSYEPGYIETLKRRLDIAELALQEAELHAPDQTDLFTRGIRALVNPFLPPHPDDSAFSDIADSFRALSLNSPGFQGKSSPAMLVTIAAGIKPFQQRAESRVSSQTPPTPKPWTLKSVCHPPSIIYQFEMISWASGTSAPEIHHTSHFQPII